MSKQRDLGERVDGEAIFRILRDEILTGEYSQGTPLREVKISERFGVSRTPVREALGRLQHERLLERGARGLRIPRIDTQEIIQIYDARVLLEEEAAKQAARDRSPADLLRLEALVERDRSLATPTDQIRIKSNLEFHAAIWGATHNRILEDLLERLSTHLTHAPHSTLSVENRWETALDEHADLVEAISKQHLEDAKQIARIHMETARSLRLQLLRRSALEN